MAKNEQAPKGGGSQELPPEVAAALSDEKAKETENVYLDASEEELAAEAQAELAAENAALKAANDDYRKAQERLERRLENLEKLNQQFIANGGANAQKIDEALQADSAKRSKDARFAMYKKIREEMGNEVVITIQPGSDPARNFDVPVSFNGRVRKLPRGVPVKVTSQELEVLYNAIEDTDIWVRDEDGAAHRIRRRQLSYPFTIHDSALQVMENAMASVGMRV